MQLRSVIAQDLFTLSEPSGTPITSQPAQNNYLLHLFWIIPLVVMLFVGWWVLSGLNAVEPQFNRNYSNPPTAIGMVSIEDAQTTSSVVQVNTDNGGNLRFEKTNYNLSAGTTTIEFTNKGVMPHNVVLVQVGFEQQVVDEAAIHAPEFLPTKGDLGHSKTLEPGQSDSFSVTLQPGVYSFICTYPGHYAAGMKAMVIVR